MATKTNVTARTIAHDVLVDLINGRTEIDSTDLLESARPILVADDDFVQAFIEEGLTVFVLDVIQQIAHSRRKTALASPRADREQSIRALLGSVFEPVDGTVRIAILAMRRPDLLAAAQERRRQASGYLRWAALTEEYAALLPDNTTVLGDALTDDQLSAIWRKHMDE